MSCRVTKSEVIDTPKTFAVYEAAKKIIGKRLTCNFITVAERKSLLPCTLIVLKGSDSYILTNFLTNLTAERSDNTGAKYTEAQKRASKKYFLQSRESLTLSFPKGCKERYKSHAKSKGKSLTALIMELLESDILK